jgi:hypothetical protein
VSSAAEPLRTDAKDAGARMDFIQPERDTSKMSKIAAGGAGIGRVTSIRSDKKTVSGTWSS